MERWDVVIIGAGVGGAAMALALAHAHPLRILLVEKQNGPGKINRGDSLLPAVTAQLARWGMLDRVYEAGARRLAKMQVFHHRSGLLMETPLEGLGLAHPYLVLPHPEIERTLTEAAIATGRVTVRYQCPAARLTIDGGRIAGVVVREEGNGEEVHRAHLTIGADGATSMVRAALGIPLRRAAYDHAYFGLEMSRPAAYDDAMRIELHPAGGILVVPHPSGERIGLGVLVRRRDRDLFRAGSFEAKLAAIRERSSLLAECESSPRGAHLYQLCRAHAPRYVAQGAALIGDAIHVTNPTAGQGMTMAIEDAACLARHVGPLLAASGVATSLELDRALRAYELQRRPLNARLIRWSHWMSRFYALPDRWGDWVRRQVFTLGGSRPGRLLQRAIWSRVAARPVEATP
jgi:2-polyprenyl-6-methoxyphenol hydroxylase-like FAD-dependent oxidoreductase